ncbi:hypothetical protein JYU34_015573 [Plutella xylostella]|uniref:Uncharacterized protein n=1 Tax=Plutella xylostella TaxID=51655 RepID=A0ABQ7Q4D5_PLUXY|nr:hypothetical protein JYU34_015573 [Plutella xylostella]
MAFTSEFADSETRNAHCDIQTSDLINGSYLQRVNILGLYRVPSRRLDVDRCRANCGASCSLKIPSKFEDEIAKVGGKQNNECARSFDRCFAFYVDQVIENKPISSGAAGGRQSRNLSSGATKNRIENRARIDSELGETRRKALLFFQVFKCDRALASLSLVVMKRRMSAISAAMLRLVAMSSLRFVEGARSLINNAMCRCYEDVEARGIPSAPRR